MAQLTSDMCDRLLSKHRSVLNELRKENFDIGITEYIDGCGLGTSLKCAKIIFLAIFHLLGIDKVFLTGSAIIFESLSDALNLPIPLSYVPGSVF